MSSSDDISEGPKRRAPAEGRAPFMAAKALVADTQKRLEHWQGRLAHLKARLLTRTGDPAIAAAEAAELVALVIAARIELAGKVAEADLAVAQQSIIRDIDRALDHLRLDLEALIDGGNFGLLPELPV